MKGKGYQSLLWLLGIFLAAATTGCGKIHSRQNGITFQIPLPDSGGTYSLQKANISTLRDPSQMSGEAATLKVRPWLTDQGLEGEAPKTRFIETADSVLVPADDTSLYLVTLYYHLERLMFLERGLGLATGVSFPRQAGVRVLLVDDPKASNRIVNNALYLPERDLTLFVPYVQAELPIVLNAGVIAHEHFHAIFQARLGRHLPALHEPRGAVNGKDNDIEGEFDDAPPADVPLPTALTSPSPAPEEPTRKADPKAFNRVFLRGINEGLADFWAWIYTGQVDFLNVSLSAHNEQRRLDKLGQFGPPSAYDHAVAATRARDFHDAIAYSVGTSMARFLSNFSARLYSEKEGLFTVINPDEVPETFRHEMARRLVKSMDALLVLFKRHMGESKRLTPADVVEVLVNTFPEQKFSPGLCSFIKDSFFKPPKIDPKKPQPDPADLKAPEIQACSEKK